MFACYSKRLCVKEDVSLRFLIIFEIAFHILVTVYHIVSHPFLLVKTGMGNSILGVVNYSSILCQSQRTQPNFELFAERLIRYSIDRPGGHQINHFISVIGLASCKRFTRLSKIWYARQSNNIAIYSLIFCYSIALSDYLTTKSNILRDLFQR